MLFCLGIEEESAWLILPRWVHEEQVGGEETSLHAPTCRDGSSLSVPAEPPSQFPILQVSICYPPLSLPPAFMTPSSCYSELELRPPLVLAHMPTHTYIYNLSRLGWLRDSGIGLPFAGNFWTITFPASQILFLLEQYSILILYP